MHDAKDSQMSQVQDGHNINVITKEFDLTNYEHSGFVTTHAFGHNAYLHTTCTNEPMSSGCITC